MACVAADDPKLCSSCRHRPEPSIARGSSDKFTQILYNDVDMFP